MAEQKLNTSPAREQPSTAPHAAAPAPEVPGGARNETGAQAREASRSDRQQVTELDPEREQVVQRVLNSLGASVFRDLAQHQPGRSVRWLAERIVDQAEVNARNHNRELSQVSTDELRQATRTTLSQMRGTTIAPREGPKADDGALRDPRSYAVADAILASVTDYGAHQTLRNYRASLKNDEEFVRVVQPALTRGERFAWSNSEWKAHGEKLQHELVNNLLRSGQIPQDLRYKAVNQQDSHAIGIEYDQRNAERDRRYAEGLKAYEAKEEAKRQAILDGYISGARSEGEKVRTMQAFRRAVENPNTDPAHRARLAHALATEEAKHPKPAPTSVYIDSTKTKYTADQIEQAQRFAPSEVLQAMKAKDPVAFERNRPASVQEIATLREQLTHLGPSISNGLQRADQLAQTLAQRSGSLADHGPKTSQNLLAQDQARVQEYQRSCRELEKSVEQARQICDRLERMQPSDPNYQKLLTEFKSAQRELLHAGGANEERAALGRELVAVERRYRLGTEPAPRVAVLANLPQEEKQQYLTTLEGTLSTQLRRGQDITDTVKAIQALDSDPKRLASYLYRLERDGHHDLVEQFAKYLQRDSGLRHGVEQAIDSHRTRLSDEQGSIVSSIQRAIKGTSNTPASRLS